MTPCAAAMEKLMAMNVKPDAPDLQAGQRVNVPDLKTPLNFYKHLQSYTRSTNYFKILICKTENGNLPNS